MTGERVLPNLGLTNRWAAGTDGWNLGMDADLAMLDALLFLAVRSATLGAPPVAPAQGDRYIVPVGATGAWAGQAAKIAVYVDAGWTFYNPRPGWHARVLDAANRMEYDGNAWNVQAAGSSGGGTSTVSGGTGGTSTVSGGSGSTGGTANSVPALTQVQIAARGTNGPNGSGRNETVSFNNAPTPGSLLVFLCAGWCGVWWPPAGAAPVGGVLLGGNAGGYFSRIAGPSYPPNSGTDQQIQVYVRPVAVGDGKDWTFNILTGDVFNVVALELTGAGSVIVEGGPLPVGQPSFTGYLPAVMPTLPGEQVWAVFESDGVPGSVAAGAGYTKQFTLDGGGAGKHQAIYAKRDAATSPGNIEVPSFTVTSGSSGGNIAATVRILPRAS